MKTWQILLHKVLALFSGFFNIVLAASVLDPSVSYLYLTILSAAQVFMVFSGFGIAHRLVMLPEDEARSQRSWPWFALTQMFGVAVFTWLYFQSVGDPPLGVLVFTSLLLLLLVLAEWMRAAIARQVGFVIYNVVLLVSAILIFWLRDIPVALGILPILGILGLLWTGRGFYRLSGVPLRPKLNDLVRSLRVAFVNQYYNLIVLLFPLVGLRSEALGVLLVFRFAIFYNWQNFFWLRFGHKMLVQTVDVSHIRRNRKFIAMNVVAYSGTVFVVGTAVLFDLFRFIPSGAFDSQFAYLLLYFATLRVVVNLCFPFEVFLLYRSSLRLDVKLLLGSIGALAVLAAVMTQVTNPFIILTVVELIWLGWRLVSWWIIRAQNASSSTDQTI